MDRQVKVEMRNVRKQLGIQNWDLDVPMVVENRSILNVQMYASALSYNLIWLVTL